MSFIEPEDIMNVNESLLKSIWKEFKGIDIGSVPRMTYQQAMDRYGSDKPDTRFGMEIVDLSSEVKDCAFKVFTDALGKGGFVRGICVPKGAEFSRSQLDRMTDLAKSYGAKGLVWIKQGLSGEFSSSAGKFLDEGIYKKISDKTKMQLGDMVLVVADFFDPLCAALGGIRSHLGKELGLIDKTKDKFLWVVDFPLFEYSPDEKRWVARHHPFTAPLDEHAEILVKNEEGNFSQLLAKAYDLVCNGYEIAGGSVRIYRDEIQQAMFRALGLSEEDTKNKFGYFIEALKYGTPPHGGIVWGMDRLVMLLAGTDAIRDIIAFPKTAKATCLMSGAPTQVEHNQLLEVGIRLNQQPKT
jgi:aspartyl-tRNA synthetase